MKYVLRVVNVLAAVVIALALLVLLRTVFTPAGEVPTLGGYSFMRTLTGSMEPAIPVHSFLITDDVDPESLQVGDIITFRSTEPNLEGALNTHRITSVYEENGQLMFRTKGDANAVEDSEPVAAVNVVGKVVFVSAALGTVVSLVRESAGVPVADRGAVGAAARLRVRQAGEVHQGGGPRRGRGGPSRRCGRDSPQTRRRESGSHKGRCRAGCREA